MDISSQIVMESFRLQPLKQNLSLLEQLAQEIPSPDMYSYFFERLEYEAELTRNETRRQAHARAWELAKRQGVEPIHNIKELQGDFWPEEESVDEFLSWVDFVRRRNKSENRSE